MQELTPAQRLKEKMDNASTELARIAASRSVKTKVDAMYMKIGSRLRVSDRTIRNYVHGRGCNGYLIEAIIEEFKTFPPITIQ